MTFRKTLQAAARDRRFTPALAALTVLALLAAGCAASEAARDESQSAAESGATRSAAPTVAEAVPAAEAGAASAAATAAVDTPPAGTDQPARSPDVMFVPTPDSVVVAMLRAAEVSEEDLVYDLGSGDGRIVIAAASRFGARGVGIDIDPVRVAEARAGAARAGVDDRVRFVEADLFETDIGDATVVTLYLLPELNRRLRPKLFAELEPGTPVVSHGFDMGQWQPDSSFKSESRDVYFWVIPANVGGSWTWTSAGGSRTRGARLELRQRFQKVEGSMTVDGTTFELLEPALRGDALSFTGRGTLDGRMVTMEFDGRVRGNTLTGNMDVSGGPLAGRRTWAATRKTPQPDIAPVDSADA